MERARKTIDYVARVIIIIIIIIIIICICLTIISGVVGDTVVCPTCVRMIVASCAINELLSISASDVST